MRCHNCGSEMIQTTKNIIFYINGNSIEVPQIQCHFCPTCGESVFSHRETIKIESFIKNFQERGKNHDEEHDC